MDFTVEETTLTGLLKLQCPVFEDNRGRFIKSFQESKLSELGLETHFPEEFITTSGKNVIRGLHLQLPPHDHIKIVSCTAGEIWDVILDLRRGSSTYGKYEAFSLRENSGLSLYIPKGFAHGFLSMKDKSIANYRVSTEHSPAHDTGVLWNSADINWPMSNPIVSERDQRLKSFSEFNSPF
jgi:dTDP-4-dehydrorhamnose 3,5-epimerase